MADNIKHLTDTLSPVTKLGADVSSLGILAATLVELLPAAAALLTIVWTLVRLYDEPRVVQFRQWIKDKRAKV